MLKLNVEERAKLKELLGYERDTFTMDLEAIKNRPEYLHLEWRQEEIKYLVGELDLINGLLEKLSARNI